LPGPGAEAMEKDRLSFHAHFAVLAARCPRRCSQRHRERLGVDRMDLVSVVMLLSDARST
jgi:hypothetical protein